MLTTDDWKMIVDAAIKRTRSLELQWEKAEGGPPKAVCFETSIDEEHTLSIWGHTSNYSYQLELAIRGLDEVIFEDRRRVTTKKTAEGIDFAGLFKAIQRQLKETEARTRRENATRAWTLVMERLDTSSNSSSFGDGSSLGPAVAELGPFGDLSAAECSSLFVVLRELTEGHDIRWTGDGYYETHISEHMMIDFCLGSDPSCFFLTVSSREDASDEFEQVIEISDYGVREWSSAYANGMALYEAIRKPLSHQEAEFKRIVKDDIVHSVLAAINGQSPQS